ncbi:hypothetical protein [uncultured Thiohalocapsa sp.]|uniref:hypothetical protein n=1 Tax=uncultured Thiohalocapsa sp. TaxID=768990 RepID=UPI0025E74A49|nr:hypothetical protein [uncultured Thiohalocapsa sp.]
MALQAFEANYYLENNPDVLAAVRSGAMPSAEWHYIYFGEAEGRMPNPFFDPSLYLSQNPDVLAAVNAGVFSTGLEHYSMFGAAEGRSNGIIVFEEAYYLAQNPDVAAAVAAGIFESGYDHFVLFGAAEGRDSAPGVTPPPVDGNTFVLTQQADNIPGNSQDNTFLAPVTQNETGDGVLANTFETGDVLQGGGGRNVLIADLIQSATTPFDATPPISATTANIQEVYFRAQTGNGGINTIDAQNMSGVEQWWSDESRSDIVIEDIRSLPSQTTFGMRLTDPGVNYTAYFNPLFVDGGDEIESSITIVIQEVTGGQDPAVTELENISVREINFALNGVEYSLSNEAMTAANTWDELQLGIEEALTTAGLADLTVTHSGNGIFVIDDTAGGIFAVDQGEALIFGAAADIDVRNRVDVGQIIDELPTETTAVLDGAGSGSQGGALNLGAMSGLRGIEVVDVVVGQDSHLTALTSFNQTPGQFQFNPATGLFETALLRNGQPNEFLEVVNLSSLEAAGDLALGITDPTAIDGRLLSSQTGVPGGVAAAFVSGLNNVRVVNGEAFGGALNIAITLDDNAIGRYLDEATGTVDFVYGASAQNDIFNIADLGSAGGVGADQDFAMQVDMAAGDDILIIDAPTAQRVSVDGGEGDNTIKVSNSHGTTTVNTFAAFANFQTYEVEGPTFATVHDFESMPGVTNVVIATVGGVSTQLINLEVDQNVTVTGKNQTVGNASTDDQFFGQIRLTDDAGPTRFITLDNTARLANVDVNGDRIDGELTVDQILVDGDDSQTRAVTIDSTGERNTFNTVNDFDGEAVTSVTLQGTQDLRFHISSLAESPVTAGQSPALSIDASTLTGNLTLALNADLLTRANDDQVTGTDGESDLLQLYGADPGSDGAASISGFETIQFGAPFAAPLALGFSGIFDTANVSGVGLYDFERLDGATTLDNIGGTINARVNGDGPANEALTFTAAAQATGNVVNLAVGDDGYTSRVTTNDVRTLNVDLVGEDAIGDAFTLDFDVDDYAATLSFSGGGEGDSVSLIANDLPFSLARIDFSEFVGDVSNVVLDRPAVPANTTNTEVVLNGYSIGINDQYDDFVPFPPPFDMITTYRLTTDAVDNTEVWEIEGFRGFNEAGVGLSNLSILDFRALGVEGLADLVVVDDGANTTITSSGDLNFEIELVGVVTTDLGISENFVFAA